MNNTTNVSGTLSSIVSIAGVVIAVIVIVVVVRFLIRIGETFEILSLLVIAVGDFVGNRRLAWLGCAALVLVCLGCTAAALLSAAALTTCGNAHPVQLCGLLGR